MRSVVRGLYVPLLLFVASLSLAQDNGHQHHQKTDSAQLANRNSNDCTFNNIGCAKTLTVKDSPKGDIWRVWVHEQSIYFDVSKDKGRSYSQPKRVEIPDEKISARNENRPKIGFDAKQGVYLSWAMPREKKYTADIRFSYSNDYGETFSTPITVNDDNLLTSHSFNEMWVSDNGEVQLVWLDGRHRLQSKQQGKKVNGSSLYYAKAKLNNNMFNFNNQMLANGTCVCCRLAIANNGSNNLAIFWRHIYGDNIREFALLTVNEQLEPKQISHDYWQINGCPHQGGGISITEDNSYHLVWFNQGQKGKGIFYSRSDNKGVLLREPLAMGSKKHRAMHPHIMATGRRVDVVWLEFREGGHQLWRQSSIDGGDTFMPAQVVAVAQDGADRPFIFRANQKHYVSWLRYGQPPITDVLAIP